MSRISALEYEDFRENKNHLELFFPYNTYLCSIPLDFQSVPAHWHEEMELIVIKKGSGIVCVDLEMRRVEAGQMVIVLPGQLHYIGRYEKECMEYENIIFRLEMLYSKEEDICTAEFLRPYRERRLFYSGWIDGSRDYHQTMMDCIEKIDRLCDKKPRGYQLGVKAFLSQFFFELFSNGEAVSEVHNKEKSLDKVKQILRKIETDYQQPLTVEIMAETVGFSQSHFMKFFKNQMGMPFIQYLNDYRLTLAAGQLVNSSKDVMAVAMDTGFPNVSYFNRLFRKKFQMTPLEYRRKVEETYG